MLMIQFKLYRYNDVLFHRDQFEEVRSFVFVGRFLLLYHIGLCSVMSSFETDEIAPDERDHHAD